MIAQDVLRQINKVAKKTCIVLIFLKTQGFFGKNSSCKVRCQVLQSAENTTSGVLRQVYQIAIKINFSSFSKAKDFSEKFSY